ncbi:MAG: PAS domain-containing protein [Janthinobacterium lividum]
MTESPGLAQITGIPTSTKRTVEDLLRQIHPQDQPSQSDQISLIRDGHPLRREFRIVRPDGTVRWVSSRIDVCLGDDGRPVRYIGILIDITERREAQRAVELNHERRAALLEAISALTWVADRFGQPLDHTAWCALTGMAPEQCHDEGWLDAVHPNDRDRVRAAYRSAIAEASVYNVDYRVLERDGRYGWVNARSTPVRDASGLVREWQGVLLPIDEGHRPVVDDASIAAPALNGSQIRGARGLLDWSLAQLASASGVSVSTIKRMEDGGEGTTRASKSDAVRRALESGGVSFRLIGGSTWMSRP